MSSTSISDNQTSQRLDTESRLARLHQASDFSLVFKKGRRIGKTSLLSLNAYRNASFHHARLGMVIPKKNAKRAVTRNAIKRVIRESFRLTHPNIKINDYVVRLHSNSPDCSLRQLKKIIREQMDTLWPTL